MAVRLSLGAGRFRLVRQLLTESVLLASISGALGIFIAMIGIRVLTHLLANGQEGFTLHAELNWHVLAVTLGLSLLCGMLFGLAPALQATRPALMSALKDRSVIAGGRTRVLGLIPRLSLTQALVAAQIAISHAAARRRPACSCGRCRTCTRFNSGTTARACCCSS